MAMIIPLSKRINLEHSYAYMVDDSPPTFEHVTLKQEEYPLKVPELTNCEETIKIEVDEESIIKTEPLEEILDNEYSFEYFNTQKESEHCISYDQYQVDSPINTYKVESVTSSDNLENSDNPLKLIKFQYVETQKSSHNTKKSKKRNSKNNNVYKEAPEDSQKSYLRMQKEKDNLQKQLVKLRADLKATKAREKNLQTELGARCMSERALEEKTAKLTQQLQESVKKEKASLKHVRDMEEKMAQVQKEAVFKWEVAVRERKKLAEKVEWLQKQNHTRIVEQKQLTGLTTTVSQLTAKFNAQKAKLTQTKRTLMVREQYHKELMKQQGQLQRNNEELQKSLLTEKKMSRFFVKERDELLDRQEKRYKETQQELAKLKHMVATMNKALTQKTAECKAQKEESRCVIERYRLFHEQLKIEREEFDRKQLEASKKVCEYCGF